MTLSRLLDTDAAIHLPRTQRIKPSSLADESRAIRGQVQALVRGHFRRDAPLSLIIFRRNEPHPHPQQRGAWRD